MKIVLLPNGKFCVEFEHSGRTESIDYASPLFFGDSFGSFVAMTDYFSPNDGIFRIEPVNYTVEDKTI
jgi:hypothetical protein